MIIPINLSHLLILLFICSVKLSRLSNISHRYFWDWQVLTSVLLKLKGRELLLTAFLEKVTSCACLFGSGLNCIFHWKTQPISFCKSLFSSSCEMSLLKTWGKNIKNVGKKECVICKNFTSWLNVFWQIIYIKNISGPSTDRWGTQDLTSSQVEVSRAWRQFLIRVKSFPLTP